MQVYYGTPIFNRLSRHNALVSSSGINGASCRIDSGIIDRIRWYHCTGIFIYKQCEYRYEKRISL